MSGWRSGPTDQVGLCGAVLRGWVQMVKNETVDLIEVPIEELDKYEVVLVVGTAEVVLGRDRETDVTRTFFGADRLKGWEAGVRDSMPRIIRIAYDGSTPQLEYLAVAVYSLKGSCCYPGIDAIVRSVKDSEAARFLDPETGVRATIPARELTADFMRVEILDEARSVWVDRRRIELASKVRHPPFSRGRREAIRQIRDAVHEVCPKTRAQWEDGFRRDMHPDREIRVWQHIALCYRQFTVGGLMDLQTKRAVFDVIVRATIDGAEFTARNLKPRTLPPERVREIAFFVEGTWPAAEYPPVPAGRT